MNRRDFLRKLAFGGVTLAGMGLGGPHRLGLKEARASTGKTLIVIFQRGGNDGLNTVVPYGDPAYYELRPGIGIAPPDLSNPDAALDLDGFFGLHPRMNALLPLYNNGQLACMPAVHYPDASQSHFVGQDMIESGTPQRGVDGWLNRHLQTLVAAGPLSGIGFSKSMPHSLQGSFSAASFSDLGEDRFDLPDAEESRLVQRLSSIFGQAADNRKTYRELLHASGNVLIDSYNTVRTLELASYQPDNSAVYPDSTLGRRLRQSAQLIKEVGGIELIAVDGDNGIWDTHLNQGGAHGRHANALGDYADSVAALVTDLGVRMSDVLVLTMTEFGRTAAENASGGTDHGYASCWLAIGDSVVGGVHNGTAGWPGLHSSSLHEGRHLAYSVDYRDVLAEVLSLHLGNTDLDFTLPGHSPTPVGFLV